MTVSPFRAQRIEQGADMPRGDKSKYTDKQAARSVAAKKAAATRKARAAASA